MRSHMPLANKLDQGKKSVPEKEQSDHSDSDADLEIPEEFQRDAIHLKSKVTAKEKNLGYERLTESKQVGKHVSDPVV